LILNALAQAGSTKSVEVFCWTLGGPGECAIKMGDHSIVLGALDQNQCRSLAESTAHTDYPGVIGPDMTARWFTDRARELSLQFLEPASMQIYSISDRPRYPGAPGHARREFALPFPSSAGETHSSDIAALLSWRDLG
jgi:hypothetical protein